jgi:hypothetical protein
MRAPNKNYAVWFPLGRQTEKQKRLLQFATNERNTKKELSL